MNAKGSAANPGTVVSVRGSVVDIRFDEHLPPIYSVLRAGAEKQIVIEVLAQRDARHVRAIAPSALSAAMADHELMFEQQRFRGKGADATRT